MPGLFFIGEVVDVTGHLGGFNFPMGMGIRSVCRPGDLEEKSGRRVDFRTVLHFRDGHSACPERVDDANAVNLSCFLKVLGEEHAASSLFGRAQDHSVPEREAVKSVKVDGS